MWLAFLQLALFIHSSQALDAPHITDRAGALSTPYKTALEEILTLHESATGEDFRVVIEKKVSLKSNDIEKAYRNLKPGTYGKEDGAVILISTEDEVIRLRLGHGLREEIVADDLGDRIEKNLFAHAPEVTFESMLIANWIDALDYLGSDLIQSGQAQAILEKNGIHIQKYNKPFPALRILVGLFVVIALGFLFLLLQEVLAKEIVFETRGTHKKAWDLRDTLTALFGSKKTETELEEGAIVGKW